MKTKNEKTANIKEEAEEVGSYGGAPIYLTLAGNGWKQNAAILTTAIYQAQEYNAPLYVTSQVGGPNKPPDCPPGFPNCGG